MDADGLPKQYRSGSTKSLASGPLEGEPAPELRTQALEGAIQLLSSFPDPFMPVSPPTLSPATSPTGRKVTSPEPLRAMPDVPSVFSFVTSSLRTSSYAGVASIVGKRIQELAARATHSKNCSVKYARITKACDELVALFVESHTKDAAHRVRLPFSEASIFRAFERLILHALHDSVWIPCIDDVALAQAAQVLSNNSSEFHSVFPVATQFATLPHLPSFAAACHHVRSMDVYKVPGDKVACLINAAKLVLSAMGTAQRMHKLAQCKAGLATDSEDVHRHNSLAHALDALKETDSLSSDDETAIREDFANVFGRLLCLSGSRAIIASIAYIQAYSDPTITAVPSLAGRVLHHAASAIQAVQATDGYKAAFEAAKAANVETSSHSPVSERYPIAPPLVDDSPQAISSWLADRGRYVGVALSDIRVGDYSGLLEEYQRLVLSSAGLLATQGTRMRSRLDTVEQHN